MCMRWSVKTAHAGNRDLSVLFSVRIWIVSLYPNVQVKPLGKDSGRFATNVEQKITGKIFCIRWLANLLMLHRLVDSTLAH